MNIEKLKPEINKIIEFVETLPEKYQEKCFELLLRVLLSKNIPSLREEQQILAPKTSFKLPIEVKAFLRQHDVPEETLGKLLYIEDDEIIPTYMIKTTMKSKAQIQIAFLTALENALKSTPSKFEFSIEKVRERCIEHGCYDSPNFKAHFRNNSKLFKSLEDEEHVELSNEGKKELAKTMLELTES